MVWGQIIGSSIDRNAEGYIRIDSECSDAKAMSGANVKALARYSERNPRECEAQEGIE
jgi:hypothetical protein